MRRAARVAETRGRGSPRPLAARLAWFAGLWLASVGAVGAVAYAIRIWLGLG